MKSIMLASAIALTLGLTAAAQADLIGYWDFEEGTGNTTSEVLSGTVSNTFDTSLIDFSTDTAAPLSGFSMNFMADPSLIDPSPSADIETNVTGADLDLPGTSAKTIVVWFKTDLEDLRLSLFNYSPDPGGTAGGDIRLVYDDGAQTDQVRLEVNSGAGTLSTGAGGLGLNGGAGLNDGEWHMLAAIIPASAQAQDIDFYIDGTIYNEDGGSATDVDTLTTAIGGSTEILLGNDAANNDSNGTGSVFFGLLDEVGVYNTALTQSELDNIRTNGIIPEPATAGLLGLAGLALLRRRRRAA